MPVMEWFGGEELGRICQKDFGWTAGIGLEEPIAPKWKVHPVESDGLGGWNIAREVERTDLGTKCRKLGKSC